MSHHPLIESLNAGNIHSLSDLHPCIGSNAEQSIWRIDGDTWTYTAEDCVLVLEATASNPRELFGLDVDTHMGAKRRLFEELKTCR